MSATAFQRARREAAKNKAVDAVVVPEVVQVESKQETKPAKSADKVSKKQSKK